MPLPDRHAPSSSSRRRRSRPRVAVIVAALCLMALCPGSPARGQTEGPSAIGGPGEPGSSHRDGEWRWQALPDLPDAAGVAGAFVGVSNGAVLVAGGANFPGAMPWEGGEKAWTDAIHVLVKEAAPGDARGEAARYRWIKNAGALPMPLAYGVSVTTDDGVLMIGGCDASRCHAEVYRARWTGDAVTIERLPPLPRPLAFMAGARVGETVYVAGGQETVAGVSATSSFFSLDLSKEGTAQFVWRELPAWPGPPRVLAVGAGQNDGTGPAFYLFSGRNVQPGRPTQLLTDAYRYGPEAGRWEVLPPIAVDGGEPMCVMGGSAVASGTYAILLMGGDDGDRFMHLERMGRRIDSTDDEREKQALQADLTRMFESHPGFGGTVLAYNTITKTYTPVGEMPAPAAVTTTAVRWDGGVMIPSGEITPGVRTDRAWLGRLQSRSRPFGWLNYTVLGGYLLGMLGMGLYFSGRQNTTDDFFRAGGRIPWWAAGLSIFSTQLSSITFLAIPAKTFATDWTYLLINGTILMMAPIVVFVFLPFYRRLNITTAYEYLELRFNLPTRLIASAMFMLFQLGRIGIVLFLPAIALALVTDIPIQWCILAMGAMSIFYTTMGGIEADIWTDVVQTVVLLGGAVLCLVLMLNGADAWSGEPIAAAWDAGKLKVLDLALRIDTPTIWVLVLGGAASNVISYGTDQSVVQRYMTTKDERSAAASIWANALLCIPASLLFFAMGTGLYLFYHTGQNQLDPGLARPDAILPLFIAEQAPVGVAGLIIAAIFAAAMSSLDSSMNSISTAFTTDFYGRFLPSTSDAHRLAVARIGTATVGVLGTAFALIMAQWNIISLWDQLATFIGLFAGGIGGIFLLGMLSRRANGIGAVAGLVGSGAVQFYISTYTGVSVLLYTFTGLAACLVIGYAVSLLTAGINARGGLPLDPSLTLGGGGSAETAAG